MSRSTFVGPIEYTHFGEILVGAIDMRAEVAVLTRSVVIEAEMEEECPSFNGNCDLKEVEGKDTFGGHIKVKLLKHAICSGLQKSNRNL